MTALSIRGLDHEVYERLRIRAALAGRSMEAEIRDILTAAVREPGEETNLGLALLKRFQKLGGVDLQLPERSLPRRPPDFSE